MIKLIYKNHNYNGQLYKISKTTPLRKITHDVVCIAPTNATITSRNLTTPLSRVIISHTQNITH